jgi:hypothetical protein
LLRLLQLDLASQGIDFLIGSAKRCFQTHATGLKNSNLRLHPRAFIFKLAAARVACFFRMYRAISRGAIYVFGSQLVLDLVKLRLQVRELAFNIHLL